MKQKRRVIYMEDKQWDSIKKTAEKKKTTISELIRSAVQMIYPNRVK